MSENNTLDGPQIFSKRYILKEPIWQSGQTSIYRATHVQLNREVAIKFVNPEVFSEMTLARFQKEAQAIARLQHPNILQIYDFDRAEDGRYFMATEFFPKGDLQRQIDRMEARGQRFTVPQAIYIAKSVGLALRHAHLFGIVHRDIKPSNIFLDGPTRVVVGDFGLAKLRAGYSDTSSPGLLIGTPAYMSPEQATGNLVDERTDIYALGVVLYYLLTGTRPFKGGSVSEVVAQHLYSPIPDITQVLPDCPPALSPIIKRALAKDPQTRYPKVDQLLHDLAIFDPQLENGEDTIHFDAGVAPDVFLPRPISTVSAGTNPVSASSQSLEVNLKLQIPYWKLAVGAIVLAMVIIAGLLFLSNRDDDKSTALHTNIPPAQGNELLVLVEPMVDTPTNIDISERITDWLTTGDVVGLLVDRIRIEPLDVAIDSNAEAMQVGEMTKATAIIWGKRDGAGWHITVTAPNREPGELQDLRMLAPNDAELENSLTIKVPTMTDFYLRILLIRDLAKEGNMSSVFYLTFTITELDQTALVLADRPLDQNIVRAVENLAGGTGLDSDTQVTEAIEIANADLALYFIRWAANITLGNLDPSLADAQRIAALTNNGEFATGLRLIAYYLLGEIDKLLTEAQNLTPSTSSAITMAFSMIQQARIGEGRFAEAQAANDVYVAWLKEQKVENVENLFLETQIYLRAVQGDSAGFNALIGSYQDFRENRFYLAANVFFRKLQPAKFAPVAFAIGGFREATIGTGQAARITYMFGLERNPTYFLLNWQQGRLDVQAGEYQNAYDRFSTAINSAPVPFPIASYDQALLVAEHADALENPRSVCEILVEANKLANSDREFYAILLTNIATLSADQGCDS